MRRAFFRQAQKEDERSSARTGPDGRCTLAVEPGEQELGVERGLEIRGRVVDEAGRPARSLEVVASDARQVYVVTAWTLGDGSFRIGGLGEEPYALAGGSDLAGWAVRGNLRPGGDPVTLALRPGGRVAVRVLGADGRPVKDAYPYVQRVDGLPVSMAGGSGATDVNGVVEVAAPAGLVEIEAAARDQTGRGSVAVAAGATVSERREEA